MNELQDKFIQNLNDKYGKWEKNSARFGTYSYGEIADDLCISGSQFSKLLYGSATNGMYERTIKNIERLKEKDRLGNENNRLTGELNQLSTVLSEKSKENTYHYRYWFLIAIIFGIIGYIINHFSKPTSTITENTEASKHILSPFFERDFNSEHISPYLSSGEAQSFCPCSAFEGSWALEKEYIIPVPVGKPGLYYVAKNSDIKMKCFRNAPQEQRGKMFIGFEQMQHELWIDTKQEPISPKYFDSNTKSYTKAFYNIDFQVNSNFKKIATIHSLMLNFFEIEGKQITRKAEPTGRYATDINYNLANEYEIDVQDVLENIIGNLVKTVCEPITNEYCNPNQLIENESTLKFNCNFTIKNENLGIGGGYPYTKSFKLIEQNYSDNLLCNCEE